LHSGHRSAGLISVSSSRKVLDFSGFKTPAFLHEAMKKVPKTKANVPKLAI
jgi:hypothetical protein